MDKIVIFSAPSGSGKSTLINHLMKEMDIFEFSISATSRLPRGEEKNGKEYYFLTPDEFRAKIANDEFLEYEEVYHDKFYGTLKSEVERIVKAGKVAIFDVDVKGGVNIKKFYGERALSVFIQPPSIEVLRQRLVGRATDAPEVIENRLERASFELSFADKFDKVVVNDDLEQAKKDIVSVVKAYIEA
ncbi:MAG: guanylate kinase [Paludibacteraceae bacterium]|nr:guanylate kinase [Paludibacteraceae bacterium]